MHMLTADSYSWQLHALAEAFYWITQLTTYHEYRKECKDKDGNVCLGLATAALVTLCSLRLHACELIASAHSQLKLSESPHIPETETLMWSFDTTRFRQGVRSVRYMHYLGATHSSPLSRSVFNTSADSLPHGSMSMARFCRSLTYSSSPPSTMEFVST